MKLNTLLCRIPQAILAYERITEFSSENIVIYSTHTSADSVSIQLYINLPEEARRAEGAATTHTLPLATLQQVFIESGDIITAYTLSSSLFAAISSSGQSKWIHFFGGGAAVVAFGCILTCLLCLGLAVYKWKQKKRQVTARSHVDIKSITSYSVRVAPLTGQSETASSFKLSSLRQQFFTSDTDTDMASMENHASQHSSLDGMGSSQSIMSDDSQQEEWPWISPTALRPLTIPNKPVWTNR